MNPGGVGDPEELQWAFDKVGKGGLSDPAEAEARQGDPQLRGGEMSVQIGDEGLGGAGARLFLAKEFFNSGGANLDDGELSGDEETV